MNKRLVPHERTAVDWYHWQISWCLCDGWWTRAHLVLDKESKPCYLQGTASVTNLFSATEYLSIIHNILITKMHFWETQDNKLKNNLKYVLFVYMQHFLHTIISNSMLATNILLKFKMGIQYDKKKKSDQSLT